MISCLGPTKILGKVSYSTPGALFIAFKLVCLGRRPSSSLSLIPPISQTVVSPNGHTVTSLWRTIRPNKEDRVAKMEWAPNGGLGRIVIGKVSCP
jgi:hypothetical protein